MRNIIEIINSIIVILVLTIPIWLSFKKYVSKRINKVLLFIMFFCYIVLSIVTDSLLPFVLVIIILFKEGKKEDKNESLMKPIGNKKLKIIFYNVTYRLIAAIITALFLVIAEHYGYKLTEQQVIKDFLSSGIIGTIWLGIGMIIFAPVVEEYIFRHLFYNNLSKKIGKKAALILTSLLFTLLHFNILGSISIFLLSILSCKLYDKYGYRAAVFNHFLFNFVTVIFLTIGKYNGWL